MVRESGLIQLTGLWRQMGVAPGCTTFTWVAGGLSDAEWSAFTALAARARIRAVCAEAIGAAAAAFGTDVAPRLAALLRDRGDEPSQRLLQGTPPGSSAS